MCSAEVFDWHAVPADQPRFDLVLACDVLYETSAAAPVVALVLALTKLGGGRWLLASTDPPLQRAPRAGWAQNNAAQVRRSVSIEFRLSYTLL